METDTKKMVLRMGGALTVVLSFMMVVAQSQISQPLSPYVSNSGKINLPQNYRTEFTFIGSWSIAEEDVETSAAASGHGAASLHNVYTQAATISAYRKTGKFPDGTVIVKELLKTKTDRLTTGQASWGVEPEGWFVMIKDASGRFDGNPLWGEGWGWALFNTDDPPKITTENFRTDCLGCHIPAKNNDYVFVGGYPTLQPHKIGG